MWKKALTAAATGMIAVTLPVQAGCTAQGDEGGGRKLVVVECERCDEADDGTPAGCKSIMGLGHRCRVVNEVEPGQQKQEEEEEWEGKR